MQDKELRQFGLWPSPISARSLASGLRLSEAHWDDDGDTLVWLEGRSGRNVLVAGRVGEAPRDLTPDVNVRARVGYGGGDFTVARGDVYYANGADGRLYRQSLRGGAPRALTPAFGDAAAPRVSPDGRYLAYVHHDGDRIDRLAVVDTDGRQWPQILVAGSDFYAQLRWSPDGRHVAYVAWNHPRMPWDGSTLYLAPVSETAAGLPVLGTPRAVAGGDETAVFQPEFTPDGAALCYASDESGIGQLYHYDIAAGKARQLTRDEGSEHALPNWLQDMRTYGIAPDGEAAYIVANKRGFARLHRVALATGKCEPIEAVAAYTDVEQVSVARAGRRIAFIGSSPSISPRLVVYDCGDETTRVAARTTGETLTEADLSRPVPLTWRTVGMDEAHGLFYPPASSRYVGTGRPPLVVIVHGGPTSQVRASYAPQAQFFTSRGYAVLYVNHRGSTGYGRDYMLKQRGAWGKVDVEDSVFGARYLAEAGKVDAERTVIMGGSAGGYTVLQTMVSEPEAFAAGICLYGIANQFTLCEATHKFEERYNDSLLGPLPQAAKLYRERSPIFHAHRIKRPLAVFQGDEDKVVPRDQSDTIVEALRRGGTPHVYHVYKGEGHGWRKSETIEHFYGAVDAFLRQYVIYS